MKMSTKKLPKANRKLSSRITPNNIEQKENNRIVFSFQALNRNDYFNLDGTCTNWSSDLFETMKMNSSARIWGCPRQEQRKMLSVCIWIR